MRALDIIINKRNGLELTKEEIDFFIEGFTNGEIDNYQASALTMAIYFRGMTDTEATHLTNAMLHSGDILDLSVIEGVKVDKHSTGGVGDKTTLVVGPLVASLGGKVATMKNILELTVAGPGTLTMKARSGGDVQRALIVEIDGVKTNADGYATPVKTETPADFEVDCSTAKAGSKIYIYSSDSSINLYNLKWTGK